jgi:hypothetical protein
MAGIKGPQMNNFPHLRWISEAKWIVVRGVILLWPLMGSSCLPSIPRRKIDDNRGAYGGV